MDDYQKAINRMKRMNIHSHEEIIRSLQGEIDMYREKINGMEDYINQEKRHDIPMPQIKPAKPEMSIGMLTGEFISNLPDKIHHRIKTIWLYEDGTARIDFIFN